MELKDGETMYCGGSDIQDCFYAAKISDELSSFSAYFLILVRLKRSSSSSRFLVVMLGFRLVEMFPLVPIFCQWVLAGVARAAGAAFFGRWLRALGLGWLPCPYFI